MSLEEEATRRRDRRPLRRRSASSKRTVRFASASRRRALDELLERRRSQGERPGARKIGHGYGKNGRQEEGRAVNDVSETETIGLVSN